MTKISNSDNIKLPASLPSDRGWRNAPEWGGAMLRNGVAQCSGMGWRFHRNTHVLPFADKAMKTNLASSIKQIKKMRGYSSDNIRKWQNKQLNALIDHAYTHTRYYKRLFKNAGLLPADIRSISDLKKLPALTKEIIRQKFDDIVSDNIQSIPHKKSSTGGSTGDPAKYWLDHRSWSMSNANVKCQHNHKLGKSWI